MLPSRMRHKKAGCGLAPDPAPVIFELIGTTSVIHTSTLYSDYGEKINKSSVLFGPTFNLGFGPLIGHQTATDVYMESWLKIKINNFA